MLSFSKYIQGGGYISRIKKLFASKSSCTVDVDSNKQFLNHLLNDKNIIKSKNESARKFLSLDLLNRIQLIDPNDFKLQILKPCNEFGSGVVVQKSFFDNDSFEIFVINYEITFLGFKYQNKQLVRKVNINQLIDLKQKSFGYMNYIDKLSVFGTNLEYTRHLLEPCDHLFIVPATGGVGANYRGLLNHDHDSSSVTILREGPDILGRNVNTLVLDLYNSIVNQIEYGGGKRFVLRGDSRACMIILEVTRKMQVTHPDISFVLFLNDPTPGNIGFNQHILSNTKIPSNVEACTVYYNDQLVRCPNQKINNVMNWFGITDKAIISPEYPQKTLVNIGFRPSTDHIHSELIDVEGLLDGRWFQTGVFVHGEVNKQYEGQIFGDNGTPNNTLIHMVAKSNLVRSTYNLETGKYRCTNGEFSAGTTFRNGAPRNSDVSGYTPLSNSTICIEEATINQNGSFVGPCLFENNRGDLIFAESANSPTKPGNQKITRTFARSVLNNRIGDVYEKTFDLESSNTRKKLIAKNVDRSNFISDCKDKIDIYRQENYKSTHPLIKANKKLYYV